uniref:Uncharacterized protein n=1 Tax=Magallana gigas TaxID=29159 RepID=K1Q5K4_MAGGI
MDTVISIDRRLTQRVQGGPKDLNPKLCVMDSYRNQGSRCRTEPYLPTIILPVGKARCDTADSVWTTKDQKSDDRVCSDNKDVERRGNREPLDCIIAAKKHQLSAREVTEEAPYKFEWTLRCSPGPKIVSLAISSLSC